MKDKEAEETIVKDNVHSSTSVDSLNKKQLWILLKHFIPEAIMKGA